MKLTGKRDTDGGVSAYVDFVDISSANKAHDSITKIGDRELRIEYNNPERSPDSLIPEDPSTASRLGHSRDYDPLHSGSRHNRYDSRRDG